MQEIICLITLVAWPAELTVERQVEPMRRTLTAYGIAVIIVLVILNGIFWLIGNPQLHDVNVFSAGFVLGMLGMYIAAWLYGYRRVA